MANKCTVTYSEGDRGIGLRISKGVQCDRAAHFDCVFDSLAVARPAGQTVIREKASSVTIEAVD